MPAVRTQDPLLPDNMDDDDGMPPLVDNPNPSMNFTFFTDMRPISFGSPDTSRFEVLPDTFRISASGACEPSEDLSALPDGSRSSHGKKRDASYIPRPPNAFILFRSSFIRSQQVPEKVEGNHSTLSKIIGMYWKTLPREEREKWEAKAIVAQAEHRKRYPDWRFRPGANAMAKLKVKDGPGTARKRTSQRKDKTKEESKGRNVQKRCAKIADLLVEGKKGTDLEEAVKEWEGVRIDGEITMGECVRGERVEEPVQHEVQLRRNDLRREVMECKETQRTEGAGLVYKEAYFQDDNLMRKTRCQTPDAALDFRFKVPLTSMFRRSLSAPASDTRSPFAGAPSPDQPQLTDSPQDMSAAVCHSPQSECSSSFSLFEQQEDMSRGNMGRGAKSVSPLMFCDDSFVHWNTLTSANVPMTFAAANETVSARYDCLTSPAPSIVDLDTNLVCSPSSLSLAVSNEEHPYGDSFTCHTRRSLAFDSPAMYSHQYYSASALDGWSGVSVDQDIALGAMHNLRTANEALLDGNAVYMTKFQSDYFEHSTASEHGFNPVVYNPLGLYHQIGECVSFQ